MHIYDIAGLPVEGGRAIWQGWGTLLELLFSNRRAGSEHPGLLKKL